MILDEPTSPLDPLGRADVRDIVLELKSRDVAVLLNSHLIGEVEPSAIVSSSSTGGESLPPARSPSFSASASSDFDSPTSPPERRSC